LRHSGATSVAIRRLSALRRSAPDGAAPRPILPGARQARGCGSLHSGRLPPPPPAFHGSDRFCPSQRGTRDIWVRARPRLEARPLLPPNAPRLQVPGRVVALHGSRATSAPSLGGIPSRLLRAEPTLHRVRLG